MTYPIYSRQKNLSPWCKFTCLPSRLPALIRSTDTPGASCRLYPAAEADTAADTVAGEEAETAEPETAENADESEGEEIQELLKSEGLDKIHGT